MIANCPSCGTHYKHQPPPVPVRARCGRCDTSLDLTRLRPYRIVSVSSPTPEQARRAAQHLPVGLDHPSLATTIAENVARHEPRVADLGVVPVWTPVGATADVDVSDTPPPVPDIQPWEVEITTEGPGEDVAARHDRIEAQDSEPRTGDELPQADTRRRGGATTIALWTSAGAIAGFGASWTMGGETITWMAAGAAFGAISGWVWLQWPSRK